MKRYLLVVFVVLVQQYCKGMDTGKEIFSLADPRTWVVEGGAEVLLSPEGTPLSSGNVERKSHVASILAERRRPLFASQEEIPMSRTHRLAGELKDENKSPVEGPTRSIKRSDSKRMAELIAEYKAACTRCPKKAAVAVE